MAYWVWVEGGRRLTFYATKWKLVFSGKIAVFTYVWLSILFKDFFSFCLRNRESHGR